MTEYIKKNSDETEINKSVRNGPVIETAGKPINKKKMLFKRKTFSE